MSAPRPVRIVTAPPRMDRPEWAAAVHPGDLIGDMPSIRAYADTREDAIAAVKAAARREFAGRGPIRFKVEA